MYLLKGTFSELPGPCNSGAHMMKKLADKCRVSVYFEADYNDRKACVGFFFSYLSTPLSVYML